jgi:hypothetical protein
MGSAGLKTPALAFPLERHLLATCSGPPPLGGTGRKLLNDFAGTRVGCLALR